MEYVTTDRKTYALGNLDDDYEYLICESMRGMGGQHLAIAGRLYDMARKAEKSIRENAALLARAEKAEAELLELRKWKPASVGFVSMAKYREVQEELNRALSHERFANECLDKVIKERDAALREVKVLTLAFWDSCGSDSVEQHYRQRAEAELAKEG